MAFLSALRCSNARHARVAMPPIDPRQIERAVQRGRARVTAVADSIDAMAHEGAEDLGGLLEELRHDARPLVERATPVLEQIERAAAVATGRKRRRSRRPLLLLALVAVAGVAAYLIWRRRDQEPAFLVEDPDRPDVTPAVRPDAPSAPDTPSGGPAGERARERAEQAISVPGEIAPRVDAAEPAPEYTAPRAELPRHAPFVTSPMQLPASSRARWEPR